MAITAIWPTGHVTLEVSLISLKQFRQEGLESGLQIIDAGYASTWGTAELDGVSYHVPIIPAI